MNLPAIVPDRSPRALSPAAPGAAGDGTGRATSAGLVPDGLVPVESPLALFVPETRLHSLQPLALYLPALLPGAVVTGSYERTPTGTIRHERDRLLRHALVVGGTRVDVTIDGSSEDGLPTMFDWDILLGVFALVEQGAADETGVFPSISLRAVCEAAGRQPSAEGLAATKRALRRFGGVRIRTRLAIQPPAPDGPGLYRSRAGAVPTVVQTEGIYWVLQVQLTTETFRDAAGEPIIRETIGRLNLNPLWLAQARGGYTAWLNAELHWRLQRAVSKRLLQIGTLAVARGDWRPGEPWELPLSAAVDLLGISQSRPARQLESLEAACQELAAHDALRYGIVPKEGRRREARVQLELGPAMLSATYYRTVAPSDPPGTRALLWHLGVFGVRDQDARAWLRDDAAGVRDALRYVYWLQSEHGGRTSPTGREPVRNWAAFLRKAVTERWSYEPEFQAWAREIAAGRRPLDTLASPMASVLGVLPAPETGPTQPAPALAATVPDAPAPRVATPITPSAPIAWPDDVWGRAAAQLAAEDAAVAAMWLEGSALVEEAEGEITVAARDEFASRWIEQKLRARLEALLSAVRERPTTLRLRGPLER